MIGDTEGITECIGNLKILNSLSDLVSLLVKEIQSMSESI